MESRSRRGDLSGPVLLIGFGALLLWINLGNTSLTLWEALSRIWPLALVAVGIDLLIPRRSTGMAVLVALLLLAVVVGGGRLTLSGTSARGTPTGEAVRVAARGPAAEIRLAGGAGTMEIGAGTAADALLTGTVRLRDQVQLLQTVEESQGRTRVALRAGGSMVWPLAWGTEERWDLSIAAGPTVTVDASLGAGDMRIDARELSLETLSAQIGAGRIEVAVGAAPAEIQLAAAVGEMVIRVPVGASVSLETTPVFGQIDLPPGYARQDGGFRSPGYRDDAHVVIRASVAIGQIRLVEE